MKIHRPLSRSSMIRKAACVPLTGKKPFMQYSSMIVFGIFRGIYQSDLLFKHQFTDLRYSSIAASCFEIPRGHSLSTSIR